MVTRKGGDRRCPGGWCSVSEHIGTYRNTFGVSNHNEPFPHIESLHNAPFSRYRTTSLTAGESYRDISGHIGTILDIETDVIAAIRCVSFVTVVTLHSGLFVPFATVGGYLCLLAGIVSDGGHALEIGLRPVDALGSGRKWQGMAHKPEN